MEVEQPVPERDAEDEERAGGFGGQLTIPAMTGRVAGTLVAQSEARVYPLLFAFLFLPYVYFNHSDGWNQGARLAQLHAVVLKHTLQIDAYHQITGDKAQINGHYYSEKAPAMSLAALPAFASTVAVQVMMDVNPDAPPGWRVSEWMATAGSVAVLAAAGGVAFFALMRRQIGGTAAFVATVALFLGSIAFPYATALFAHAGTIGLLCIVLWSVFEPWSVTKQRDTIGGVAAGFAIASEYPAVFPLAVLGLYLLIKDFRRAFRFGAAMLPGIALILLVNALTTGHPLKLAYGANTMFPEISASNFFGFTLPDGRAAWALLWGEYRGLFFWNPVLLLAIPGLVALARWNWAHALVVVVGVAMVLVQASSFSGWTGGNAVGPRYLSPAIPLLAVAAAHGIKQFPRSSIALVLLSVLLMGMVTAIAIDPPADVARPLRDYYFARIQQDRWVANLGILLGLSPMASLAALAAAMAPFGGLVWYFRNLPVQDEAA
jgi:hypothetical protein